MFFGKKAARPLPIAEAQTMISSGTPDTVVRDRLKQGGYTDDEVSRSIDQAHVKLGVAPNGGPFAAPAPWESQAPPAQGQAPPPWERSASARAKPPWEAPPAEEPQAGDPFAQNEQVEQQYQEGAPQEEQPAEQQPWQVPEGDTSAVPEEEPQAPQPDYAAQPLEYAPAQQAGTPDFSHEDFQVALDGAISNLKAEFDSKMLELEGKLDSVSHLEESLKVIVADLDEIKGKYTAMSERSEKFIELEGQVLDVKGNVSSILQILKATLPPVIKTLKELKEKKP